MEKQAYHIQALLVDELERCKGKREKQVKVHIKEIQEVYQEVSEETHQSIDINKWKQKIDIIQDEEMLLYKLYNISSEDSWPKTPEPMFI